MRAHGILVGLIGALMLSPIMQASATPATATQSAAGVVELKKQIVQLAKSYEGQGDPDFTRQRSLEVLVKKLLRIAPQPPARDRLKLLYGTWKQVWGPYDYRGDDRGVDPELEASEIYQVIFEDGYYYNVSPLNQDGDRSRQRIGLLRGEYSLDPSDQNSLLVEFTDYPGLDARPKGLKKIWKLAALSEAGELENEITIVPTWIVRLFFGGGALREVYTDSNLRILYGSNGSEFKNAYLYIMTKVR